ncbi:hypothetical protein ACFXHA_12920 [Nocardia sp. NPDC059240]|uniref:hypothetical protein n=1 Tax=Nocardia sp. NPDC059240 TaxID=3346786 RepID=UPI00368A8EEB
MRVIVSTVALIAAVLSVSACQSGSDTSGPHSTTAEFPPPPTSTAVTSTAAPSTDTTAPKTTTTEADSNPCDTVTAAILQQVAASAHASSVPVEFKQPQCVQGWALASSKSTPAAPQSSGYLFHATSPGAWRYITVGSAIDCTNFGMPHEVAAKLQGCRS